MALLGSWSEQDSILLIKLYEDTQMLLSVGDDRTMQNAAQLGLSG